MAAGSDADAPILVKDLKKPDFTAATLGHNCVGDVTYIPSWQGLLYTATIIDCHSENVAGCAIADRIRVEHVEDVLKMVAVTQKSRPRAVLHSSPGSVYISGSIQAVAQRFGMRSSMVTPVLL